MHEQSKPGADTIHPWPVRLTHWANAIAILILIGSGWRIYNADPIVPFRFPEGVTIGGWLGGALLWHFAAMWLLMASFVAMLGYGLVSGHFRRKLWPIRPMEIVANVHAALAGRLSHADVRQYNAVQKLLYAAVLALILVVIASGFAIWKPVQLAPLTGLMGGFQGARIIHFAAMAAITGFLVVHVVMALLVPKTIRAMLRGR